MKTDKKQKHRPKGNKGTIEDIWALEEQLGGPAIPLNLPPVPVTPPPKKEKKTHVKE